MTLGPRTFVELFAGGGLSRAGLGDGWCCLLACDIDEAKAHSYRQNYGADHLVVGVVRNVKAADITGRPDLLWASPPCQDVSVAGAKAGTDGTRSGALWAALDLVRQLSDLGRRPRTVVIENVTGLATSRGGKDLVAITVALASAGYRVGALMVDAKMFLPQSRKRLFIFAAADDAAIPTNLTAPGPQRQWHPAALLAAAKHARGWVWWNPPLPPGRRVDLVDLLLEDVPWQSDSSRDAILRQVSARDAGLLDAARSRGRAVGTLVRRTQADGHCQAQLRLDGIAACLLTAAGGASVQTLVDADSQLVRTRALLPRECARLMGLPDTYRLPSKREEALRLLGDGVAVPVVRFLKDSLLEPVLEAFGAAPVTQARPGIKGATRSTTVYLLPSELTRLRHLAVTLDASLHDLLLRGLDHVLATHGQRPLERYRWP